MEENVYSKPRSPLLACFKISELLEFWYILCTLKNELLNSEGGSDFGNLNLLLVWTVYISSLKWCHEILKL